MMDSKDFSASIVINCTGYSDFFPFVLIEDKDGWYYIGEHWNAMILAIDPRFVYESCISVVMIVRRDASVVFVILSDYGVEQIG